MSEEEKTQKEPVAAPRQSILIVDEDELNLKVIAQVLGEEYDVFLANGARQAFKVIDSENIKVIVAEHNLSRMTALEFFEELEQTGNYATRIVMTDFAGHAAASQALDEQKVFFVLIKPVDVIRLKHEIPEAIEDYVRRGGRSLRKRSLDDLV